MVEVGERGVQELIGVSDKQRGLEGRKIIGCLVLEESGNLGMFIKVIWIKELDILSVVITWEMALTVHWMLKGQECLLRGCGWRNSSQFGGSCWIPSGLH